MSDSYLERVLKNVASGRSSHAYLFHGASEAELRAGAMILAQSLNCPYLDESGRPCQTCVSCRKIERGVHPDLTWVLPDEASMKIGQIRPLMEIAQKKPIEGRTKIIILENIHKMTEQAANSLLKLLEDPPGSTALILITQELELVLPTIISRCWDVSFREESRRETPADTETALRILESLPVSLLEVFRWSAALDKEKDKGKAEEILDSLEFIYRDRMVQSVSNPEVFQSPRVYVEAQGLIREALWMFSRNVNTLLILESLFLDLRKIEINEQTNK